jgi:transcriptional regulator with XRE-family HTH domain
MTKNIKKKSIATRLNMSPVFVSRVKNGKQKTESEELAIALSELTGKPAIKFIVPRLRTIYLRANPALKEKAV